MAPTKKFAAAAAGLFTSVYAAAATSGEFNVLTFNVAGLPEILQPNDGGDKTTKTAAIGTAFANSRNILDIINVQEDFNYHATLYEYDNHPYRTATSGGAGIGSGLNTLSNYDWIDDERVKWDKCYGVLDSGNDCLTPKGFTFLRVRIDEGVYIDCYNLHADAGSESGDITARAANMQQVVNYINTNSVGNPVIVWGDTNTRYTRTGDNIRAFSTGAGMTDVWVELIKGGVAPTEGAEAIVCGNPAADNNCEVVDKVLYRPSTIVNLQATQFQYAGKMFVNSTGGTLSDHNPILANFTYTLSSTLRQSDLYGGPHGTWFSDLPSLPSSPRLSSVTIRGGSRVDGVSFSLTSGKAFTHGGTGGTAYSLTLASGEYITTAYTCWGQRNGRTRIFHLKLTTSTGRTVSGGDTTSDCATVSAPASGWGIVASLGRDGDEIDRLGFIYAKY